MIASSASRLCATEHFASFVYRRVCLDRLRRHPMRGRKSRSCCCYLRRPSSSCCSVSILSPIWPDQPVEHALNRMSDQRIAVIWSNLNAPSEPSLVITGAWTYMKTSSSTSNTSSESGAHPPVLGDSGRRQAVHRCRCPSSCPCCFCQTPFSISWPWSYRSDT
jgi:hypothetical protein